MESPIGDGYDLPHGQAASPDPVVLHVENDAVFLGGGGPVAAVGRRVTATVTNRGVSIQTDTVPPVYRFWCYGMILHVKPCRTLVPYDPAHQRLLAALVDEELGWGGSIGPPILLDSVSVIVARWRARGLPDMDLRIGLANGKQSQAFVSAVQVGRGRA